MNRADLEQYILESYSTGPEYLWIRYPNYGVFRHSGNRKWVAAIMDVPRNKLGLTG